MDAYEILVIVLSCLLGVFLILSIVIASLVIKLVSTLRDIAEKGEQIVDSAEEIGETIKQNVGAIGIIKLIMKVVELVNVNKSKRG